MMAFVKSLPSFEETWIECLGDLAHYRMAMEEADLHDREVWSGVARMWAEHTTTKQLANDVKGIYPGLVMVEKKYDEIDQQQVPTTTELPNQ
jgi:hypothetical protein